jgi:hypothetical protein
MTLFPDTQGGYVKIIVGPRKVEMFHRFLVEELLGVRLPKKASIHHVDRDKRNNSSSNLVVLENEKEHQQLHARQKKLERTRKEGYDPVTHKRCPGCEKILGLNMFYSGSSYRCGFSAYCNFCTRSKQKTQGENSCLRSS